MSRLDQMEIFYFVATWHSFSRAALELGVSKGYVSTQINLLEQDLKVKLIQRTTRHLSLTEEGHLFLESCAKIVREKQSATSLLMKSLAKPSGHLKITAPPSMCQTFLSDLLPMFQNAYPDISLTIDSSSEVKNLLQHGIDIALRITATPDDHYIARMIASFRFVVCATPHYLKKHKKLKMLDDLLQHNCLIYSSDPAHNRWPFQVQASTKIVSVQSNLISSDSTIIKNALLAHQGITRLPNYVLAKEIANGKLIILFSENTTIEMPIYAIYASNITIAPKVTCFISFLNSMMK